MTDTQTEQPEIVKATDWPTTSAAATADQMIKHAARVATIDEAVALVWMRASDFTSDEPEQKRRRRIYVDHISAFIANAQVARLLSRVQRINPGAADELAADIWEMTEDGGLLTELTWESLHERGIDPNALAAWAEDIASKLGPDRVDESGAA